MGRAAILAICCLVSACGGDGETHVCFVSAAFCEDFIAGNDPPRADAGPDGEAASGDAVRLDGSGSSDLDGTIASYSWTQESGPPIVLSGSTQAVAEFVAPDVDAETVLDFRLVVTDNDAASDTDRVRITVLPADQAALRAGVAQLESVYRPDVSTDAACRRCWSYLGLWLAARARAAASGADDEIDALLDEIRVIETRDVARAPVDRLAEPELTVFRLGQCEVAAFTLHRDPATAELALAEAPDCAGYPRQLPSEEAWQRALATAYPGVSPAAARTLLRSAGAADPDTVAAATLLLAVRAPR